MNYMKIALMLIITGLFSFSAMAENVNKEVVSVSEQKTEEFIEAKIILFTLDQLVKDDLITEKSASEAKKKYVFNNSDLQDRMKIYFENNKSSQDTEISVDEFNYFTGALKFIGALFGLFLIRGILKNVAEHLLNIILFVPTSVYQLVAFSLSMVLTFFPELIWESEAFYLALVGSITNLLVIGWAGATNKDLVKKLSKLFSLGILPQTIGCIYLGLYFGGLTLMYESSVFGLLSVACFVSATGFVIYQFAGGIALGVDEEKALPIVIMSNGLAIGIYSFLSIGGYNIPGLEYFSIGIEYACSLALSICLLIGASPWFSKDDTFAQNVILMIVFTVLGFIGSSFYGLSVIGAFMNTVFVIWALEWIGFKSLKAGFLIFSAVACVACFALALLLESNSQYFVTSFF
jgi:hypothetical protein